MCERGEAGTNDWACRGQDGRVWRFPLLPFLWHIWVAVCRRMDYGLRSRDCEYDFLRVSGRFLLSLFPFQVFTLDLTFCRTLVQNSSDILDTIRDFSSSLPRGRSCEHMCVYENAPASCWRVMFTVYRSAANLSVLKAWFKRFCSMTRTKCRHLLDIIQSLRTRTEHYRLQIPVSQSSTIRGSPYSGAQGGLPVARVL